VATKPGVLKALVGFLLRLIFAVNRAGSSGSGIILHIFVLEMKYTFVK
jgi:hypothetical protein